jgi:segregation and condensation protein A
MAEAALAPKPVPVLDLSHITPIRVTVAEAVAEVLRVLAQKPSTTFRELTQGCSARIDVVVRFLAVLELIKRGEADVTQAENFGEISIARAEGATGAAIVVDEYEGAPVVDLSSAEASLGEEPGR